MHTDSTGSGEGPEVEAAGCDGAPVQPASRWFRGRYLAAFEVSSFQPDGSTERWWTSFHEHLADEATELIDSARGTPVDVELVGDVSEPGEYGHMGLYSREFKVHAIRRRMQ